MPASKAQKWALDVSERDGGRCAAMKHDPRCTGRHEETHHICYKIHIPKFTYWVVANGIALSLVCHQLAHKTRNANISADRKRRAVDGINALIPDSLSELRRPHFEVKAA